MPHPTHKAIVRCAVTALLIAVVAYPLSYAPVVRWKAMDEGMVVEGEIVRITDGSILPVYKPVDWIIDNTPLRKPMFLWARLWGVEEAFRGTHLFRELSRRIVPN